MNEFINKELLFTIEDHVATITLNRPETYNALSDTMREGLRQIADILRTRKDIWLVVLTGAGKAFCAGGDIKVMKKRIEAQVSYRERLETYRHDVADVVRDFRSIPQLVIAQIGGAAYGAGCSLAMLCDIRIASEKAKFGLPFGKRGLIPDWGATFFLPRLIGTSKALSLCATGKSFTAAEGLQMGFLDEIVPHEELESYVKQFCEEIKQSSPFAVKAAKVAIYQSLTRDLDAALEVEAKLQSACYLTDDHKEGVDCFLEKRPAVFTGK